LFSLSRLLSGLPPSAGWYDFWSGKLLRGGQEIEAEAPLDRMPLIVRAGSIIPMGPAIEFASQDPAEPIEILVYGGTGGKSDLYEGSGDGYDYQQGQHSVIPIRWDDRGSVLTIRTREGSFPGMVERRRFRVVLVNSEQGVGVGAAGMANAEAVYEDKELKLAIR